MVRRCVFFILKSCIFCSGYGYTLASVIGGLYQCPLGMPYGKVKTLFTLTDELLLSSSQSGKLALCKVQTGWVMMGALCTLGLFILLRIENSMGHFGIILSSYLKQFFELDLIQKKLKQLF